MIDTLLPAPRRMTRRLCAVVLGGQAPVVVFGALGAWGLAGVSDPGRASLYLWSGLGLAVACVVAAGLTRMRLGIILGWLVQLSIAATAIVVRPMLVVAFIFGGLWIVALVQGRKMDDLSERYADAVAGGPVAGDEGQRSGLH